MWQYSLFDYPLDGSEGDLETWCTRHAEDGWELWYPGIGAVIDHEGREVRRLSLRRQTSTPMSTPRTSPQPDRTAIRAQMLPG